MVLSREKVRFERVFDVVRSGGPQKFPHTLFGFESATGVHCGVEIPGAPRIEAGDTILAVLDKPGNWQTLRGWRNLETGEVAAPPVGGGVVGSIAMLASAIFCAYLTGQSASYFLQLLVLLFLAGSAYWARFALIALKIRRELNTNSV